MHQQFPVLHAEVQDVQGMSLVICVKAVDGWLILNMRTNKHMNMADN